MALVQPDPDNEEKPPEPGVLSYFSDPRYGQNRRNLAAALGLTTILLIAGTVLFLLPRPASERAATGNPSKEQQETIPTPPPSPTPSEASVLRKTALEALGRNEGTTAETALRQAVALEPDNAAAWSNLGAALMVQNRPEEALDAIDQSIILDPTLVRAYSNRAQIHRRYGRLPEAIADLRKASELAPSDAVLSNRLLLARIENGETDVVRSEVSTSRRLSIPSLEQQSIIAEAALAAMDGDYPSALTLLARARQLLSQDAVHNLLDDPVFVPHMSALILLPGGGQQ